MELINNTTKTLRDDLAVEIKQDSRLSVAAACFSIYAFQELKKELQGIDELRLEMSLRKRRLRKNVPNGFGKRLLLNLMLPMKI